jgi:class 3 adenylate cyclase/predicted ATPase
MRCAKCGTNNPPTNNFCAQCGSALVKRCAKCNQENPPASNFCGKCGASLDNGGSDVVSSSSTPEQKPLVSIAPEQTEASLAIEGERKTVTALFADIKGSTELEQDLDPEEARAIIDPALKIMIDAVHRYDGYIVQSTGDGIFALFGAPVAHEDHPQRALYAALRMQEELERYSARLRELGNLPIEARVGVNTGEVVVRSISTGGGHVEYTPIGHTTNLASRMQALAPTGSIAAAESTRKLCEGYFILKPLGATKVKGVSEPVNVYEVTGLGPLRTRLQRSAGRGLTKFVGRVAEMESLKRAAEQVKTGRGQIVAAMAEAGTGKSRLFFEFKAVSQSGWMVLETFSVSHGKASAYFPVIDLLHGYFGIEADDDARKRREKVAGKVVILDRALEDTLPYLYGLLGIAEQPDPLAQMDAQVRRRRTLEAIKRILLRESLSQPLMVIFEDLHWIDDETQGLLNLLADSIGTARILLLVNYRPEYSHQWNSKTYYTQLRLDPLGIEGADEMLTAMLGDGVEVRPLKRLIIERTGGNPFFMEETVQVLLDEGALVRNGTVKLTKPLNELRIPPTVQAILAARIDRLPGNEKDLLQALAVIGKEFQLSLVRAVLQPHPQEEAFTGENRNDRVPRPRASGTSRSQAGEALEGMLDNLQLAEFIYEQPAAGDIEYSFKHALTQEVAYNSVLIERRKVLHERIGAAIENLFGQSIDDHLSELAHHYARSGNAHKAVEYLRRAGEQATRRGADAEAIRCLKAGLELVRNLPDPNERASAETHLRLALRTAYMSSRGPADAEVGDLNERLVKLARESGDQSVLFSVLIGVSSYRRWRAELTGAREVDEQLMQLARTSGDPERLMMAGFLTGATLQPLGQIVRARSAYDEALQLEPEIDAGDRPHPVGLTHAFGLDADVASRANLALTLWYLGFPDRALASSEQGVSRARQISSPFSLTFALLSRAMLHHLRCERGEMANFIDQEMQHAETHGFGPLVEIGEVFRSSLTIQSDQIEAGIARAAELIESRDRVSRWNTIHLLGWLAQRCLEVGGLDQACDLAQLAIERVEARSERVWEAELRRILGEAALAGSNPDEAGALASFEKAIQVARLQEAKSWELRATTSLARLLDRQGKRDEARAMLAEIYNWFTEGFDTADLKEAKALLDDLNG